MRSSILVPLLALLSACASTAADPPQLSGFLGDHPALAPSPRDPEIWVWARGNADYSVYDSILFDPVQTVVAGKEDDPELHNLGDLLRSCVASELEGGYEIVTAPGTGTLRFRMALTGVVPATGDTSPQARDATARFDLGGASMELEVSDATSGERLAVAASSKNAQALSVGRPDLYDARPSAEGLRGVGAPDPRRRRPANAAVGTCLEPSHTRPKSRDYLT